MNTDRMRKYNAKKVSDRYVFEVDPVAADWEREKIRHISWFRRMMEIKHGGKCREMIQTILNPGASLTENVRIELRAVVGPPKLELLTADEMRTRMGYG